MYVLTDRDLIKQFFQTSNKYRAPGKFHCATGKTECRWGFGDKFFSPENLYLNFHTEHYYTNIIVDIDDEIEIDVLDMMVDMNIIPRPIYVAGTIKMGKSGEWVFHRPHIYFAMPNKANVRFKAQNKEIKNGKGKGKSAYKDILPNFKALEYYKGCHRMLCDIFAMQGCEVDYSIVGTYTKSPFSPEWDVKYYGDETYTLSEFMRYNTDDVQQYRRELQHAERMRRQAQTLSQLQKLSVDPLEFVNEEMRLAVQNTLNKPHSVHSEIDISLSREEIATSISAENNRNTTLFTLLRKDAYKLKPFCTEQDDFDRQLYDIMHEILIDVPCLSTLPSYEISSTYKSVKNWTWFCYRGTGKRSPRNEGAAAHLIHDGMTIAQKQAVGAGWSNQVRRENSYNKVKNAVYDLKAQGSKLTQIAVAKLSGLTRQTVSKYLVDGELTFSGSKLFKALMSSVAIPPSTAKALRETAINKGDWSKIQAAAAMLITVVSEEGKNIEDCNTCPEHADFTYLELLELALIRDLYGLLDDEIDFERLENYLTQPKTLLERVGVSIDYTPAGENRSDMLLASLDKIEQRKAQDDNEVPWDYKPDENEQAYFDYLASTRENDPKPKFKIPSLLLGA